MITLFNTTDTNDFKGRKFKQNGTTSPEYTCVGYGDNGSNGNPFLVGVWDDNGKTRLTTLRFKDIELVP